MPTRLNGVVPLLGTVIDGLPVRRETTHFRFTCENGLAGAGDPVADFLATVCEQDYETLRGIFGGVTPAWLPFVVRLCNDDFGGRHPVSPGPVTHIAVGLFSGGGIDAQFCRWMMLAEMEEVFGEEAVPAWSARDSNGEGLSRVLASSICALQVPSAFQTGRVWLGSTRPDFVNQVTPSDIDDRANGCSVLFLNWMRFQLNIGWGAIAAAGRPLLAQTYHALTGAHDGWARFSTLMDARFPPGNNFSLVDDNPFPV